ncbi:hypothetical protein AB0K52_16445 [Glycomyces sp. NPDC049804]|uniref:hypothetical protein n=1 Tax=Glycomyces sp. NPDC049804 TaxID=3154363 RepID=UPI00344A72A2
MAGGLGLVDGGHGQVFEADVTRAVRPDQQLVAADAAPAGALAGEDAPRTG